MKNSHPYFEIFLKFLTLSSVFFLLDVLLTGSYLFMKWQYNLNSTLSAIAGACGFGIFAALTFRKTTLQGKEIKMQADPMKVVSLVHTILISQGYKVKEIDLTKRMIIARSGNLWYNLFGSTEIWITLPESKDETMLLQITLFTTQTSFGLHPLLQNIENGLILSGGVR